MEISYEDLGPSENGVAKLRLNGGLVRYVIPFVKGVHEVCFSPSKEDSRVRFATGKEIVAFAYAFLDHRASPEVYVDDLTFMSLRFRKVITFIPKTNQYGDLKGGCLVDEDVHRLGMQHALNVPESLLGWEEDPNTGLYSWGERMFVPRNRWQSNPKTWDAEDGLVIALSGGIDAARTLEGISSRVSRKEFKLDFLGLSLPTSGIPLLVVSKSFRSCCSFHYNTKVDSSSGYAARVLRETS